MSENIIRYEQFNYSKENPFQILNVYRYREIMETDEKLQHHWHSEMEICYIHEGQLSKHVVDGEEIQDSAGKVIVVNSDSIHNIIDCYTDVEIGHIAATVIIISRDFLCEIIPDYEKIYFIPDSKTYDEKIASIIRELSKYGNQINGKHAIEDYDDIHIKSLIMELVYRLLKTRLSWRNIELPINKAKNLERIKGVVSYVEKHYSEPISQADIANKFYFSVGYFSRYFHKAMNMTFVEYISRYRTMKARELLISTKKSVMDIAMECGFADSRRFIISFKKQYGMTPLQYRKVECVKKW